MPFFTPYDGSIRVIFIVVCPMNADRLTTRGQGCSLKCLSQFQTVILPLHRSQPDGAIQSVSSLMIGVGRLGEIPGTVVEEREGS